MSVVELDDGSYILHHSPTLPNIECQEGFQRFGEFALHPARLRGFDRGADETYTTSDTMHEEFRRTETLREGILHVAPGFDAGIALVEMREEASVELVGQSPFVGILLPHCAGYLIVVDDGAFGTTGDGVQNRIVVAVGFQLCHFAQCHA